MSKTEEGTGMVSNLGEDLREQRRRQQQQQYQQDPRDLPNLNAPRPDSERSATQDETTNIVVDDDMIVQNCPQEGQEHAPATQAIPTSSGTLIRSNIALFEGSAGS